MRVVDMAPGAGAGETVAASLVSLGAGVPLMAQYGAIGAAWVLVASYATFAMGRFALLAWRQR